MNHRDLTKNSPFFQSRIDNTFNDLLDHNDRTAKQCSEVISRTSMIYSDNLKEEEELIKKNQQIIDRKKQELHRLREKTERFKKDFNRQMNSNNVSSKQAQNIFEKTFCSSLRHSPRINVAEINLPVFEQTSAKEVNTKQKCQPQNNRKLRSNKIVEDQPSESDEQNEYSLKKIQYTPNITQLKFVLFEYKGSFQFDQEQVDNLQHYNIDQIQAVMISTKEMDNLTFASFSKLNWNNLKSLKIQSNQISDLRPLKQLNYTILQDLDISFNPLKQDSAKVLAYLDFQSLIYLTVSFAKDFDNLCWKILLAKKMVNFPKLQRLDVGNSPYLSTKVKKEIESCIQQKSVQQISKKLNLLQKNQRSLDSFLSKIQRFQNPKEYSIKIKWLDTDEAYQKYTKEDFRKRQEDWCNQVSYKCHPTKSLVKLEKPKLKINRASENDQIKKKRGRKKKQQNDKLPAKHKKIQKY